MGDDTWGIAGTMFLQLFAIAAALAVAGAYLTRAILTRGQVRGGWDPGAEHLAYLLGGNHRATLCALAALRAVNAVTAQADGRLAVTGLMPADAGPLTYAVYQAAYGQVPGRDIDRDPRVRAVLDDIHRTLVDQGWLLSAGQQATIRRAAIPVFVVAAVGGGRILAGMANSRPVTFLIILTLVLGGIGMSLLNAPREARATKELVAGIRARNAHLEPRAKPALATYGAGGAALAVGLYGGALLWVADPTFASDAGLPSAGASDSGGGSGDSGGGDSGSGCGGGGGCGGGCGG
jgi:uncharacterized protein (TIGR04222 family)